jgi:hypothetical protein
VDVLKGIGGAVRELVNTCLGKVILENFVLIKTWEVCLAQLDFTNGTHYLESTFSFGQLVINLVVAY